MTQEGQVVQGHPLEKCLLLECQVPQEDLKKLQNLSSEERKYFMKNVAPVANSYTNPEVLEVLQLLYPLEILVEVCGILYQGIQVLLGNLGGLKI